MAEKNFFDLLKEKMAALRPSARHREEDWAALTARLDEALPRQPQDRRRAWLPLLLLLLALLSSNALWWNESLENRTAMRRIELQLAGLQTAVASFKPAPQAVRTDTVWRTVYIRIPAREQFTMPLATVPDERVAGKLQPASRQNGMKEKILPQPATAGNSAQPGNANENIDERNRVAAAETANQPGDSGLGKDSTARTIITPLLESRKWPFLKSVNWRPSYAPDYVITPEPKGNTRPLGPVLLNALKPKYFKVGAIAGLLYPVSPALMHQSGFESGAHGSIGFSRHWSAILEYTFGQLHYESNEPAAILGSPEFPVLSSPDEYFTHLDLKRQSLRQFGLGLRYTFGQPGKTRPFIGINWGNQSLKPYTVVYEIKHEPSNTVQQGLLVVDETTHLRNVLRFGAGLEVPLSRRFDLTFEGFYMRQWKKKNKDVLDMTGIRVGINWMF